MYMFGILCYNGIVAQHWLFVKEKTFTKGRDKRWKTTKIKK